MPNYEFQYYSDKINYIVGTDEAGRGPLAGPVVAAAVIFPKDYYNEEINDSKKLTEAKREKLFNIIKENALAYAICVIDAETIDDINILEASRRAMTEAIKSLNHPIDYIVTDCMKLYEFGDTPVEPLVKGDAKCQCIAAASILAKVTRDHIMDDLDKEYPQYHFKENKGYGTKSHLDALEEYGPVKGLHRYSYGPVKKFLLIKLF